MSHRRRWCVRRAGGLLAIRLGRCHEQRALLRAVDDIGRAGRDAGRIEGGQAERPVPGMTAIIGVKSAPDAGMDAVGAYGQGKIGMREVYSALAVAELRQCHARSRDAMQVAALGQKVAAGPRILESPSLAAIHAPCQHGDLGLFAVDMMAVAEVFVPAHAETDEDLVPPAPDAVIGRPAPEHPLLEVDLDVAGRGHAVRCARVWAGGRRRPRASRECDEQHGRDDVAGHVCLLHCPGDAAHSELAATGNR